MLRGGQRRAVGLLLVLAAALLLWWTQGTSGEPEQEVQRTDSTSGLPVVRLSDLPPEAGETLRLIQRGGPFPEERDGVTFENRERLLPDRPRGYYREYTVRTPGSSDRGPRRIVTGDDERYYWTSDHYRSFAVVER